MKRKTIFSLYEELPKGTPEEFPEKFRWLEKNIKSLLRTTEKPYLCSNTTKNKPVRFQPPDECH